MTHLTLRGRPGNLDAVGARVTAEISDGTQQTAEVYAGGSYLSQSTPALFFGSGEGHVTALHVRWPDGSSTSYKVAEDQKGVLVSQPAAK